MIFIIRFTRRKTLARASTLVGSRSQTGSLAGGGGGRKAKSHVPSEENNKTFGRAQSFVAGGPTEFYLQFMVKDSKKYAATEGWDYSSFDQDGKPTDEAVMMACFPCHQTVKERDFIFTRYPP